MRAEGRSHAEDPVNPPAAPRHRQLLLPDDAEPTTGVLHRSVFLDRLETSVRAAAAEVFGGTPFETSECPHIEFWFGFYRSQSTEHLERALARFAPAASRAGSAEEAIVAATGEARRRMRDWLDGRDDGMGVMLSAESAGGRPLDPHSARSRLGAGQPLSTGMGTRLGGGHDPSVRVHTDGRADEVARSMGARAFAVGPHIGFRHGAFQPGTIAGDALIAHELAHVEQQRGGGRSSGNDVSLEQAADDAAVARLLGRSASVGSAGLRVQGCQEDLPSLSDYEIDFGDGSTEDMQAARDALAEHYRVHVHPIFMRRSNKYGIGMSGNEWLTRIARLDAYIANRGDPDSLGERVMRFDGTTLTMGDESWPAVSGRDDGGFDYSVDRQRLPGTGPIPEGDYWIDPTQLVSLDRLWDVGKEPAWGTHRVTLHPYSNTNTYGRGGFFLHGGTTAGSAGCIDTTTQMSDVAEAIARDPFHQIKVEVRYPTTP